MRIKKTYILEQHLLNYRLPIYELLSKEFDITILFWNLKNRFYLKTTTPKESILRTRSVKVLSLFDKLYIPFYPLKVILTNYGTLIIRGNVRNISIYYILFIRKCLGLKTIIWGQGTSRNRAFDPKKNFLDLLNLFLIRLSDSFVFYDDYTCELMQNFTNPKKLFVAKNTINFYEEQTYYDEISTNEEFYRKEINISTKLNFCFIGRLDKRKRLNRVLEYFNLILRIEPSSTLWIIGDGPERNLITKNLKKNKKIKYVGSKYNFDAAKYLYFSDATLMPGWMGLAVNHSLFYRSPIFSEATNKSLIGHAPEGHYIVNGENGYVIDKNNNRRFDIVFREFISKKEEIKTNARNYALSELSPDLMLNGIKKAINYTQK